MRLDGQTQKASQTRFHLRAHEARQGEAAASRANERVAGDNEPLKQEHVHGNIVLKAPKIYNLTPVNGQLVPPEAVSQVCLPPPLINTAAKLGRLCSDDLALQKKRS